MGAFLADGLFTAAIGFAAGLLSGAFGIGGGIVTTPALRLILGAPALVAVGTPLPVIIPTAITGAWSHHRNGTADVRAGATMGIAGSFTAILGAWATGLVGGSTVLIATAALIVWSAGDMALQALRPPVPPASLGGAGEVAGRSTAGLIAVGLLTGLYSGFFGLGGGFVIVPLLTRWLHFSVKRAVGTSLVAVALLAVPGTVTHAVLGHVDWALAAALAVGVVPGALVGAHFVRQARDNTVRISFAVLLIVVALWLAVSEIVGLG